MNTTQPGFQQNLGGLMSYPHAGWRRWLFKAPIHLWRLGLGPLLGQIMILITHTGRKSGLPRRTMAEYYRLDGRKYAVAAFGRRAQWCLNLLADPRVTIQTSDGAQSARAVRVLDERELEDVVRLFMRHDPPLTKWYLNSLDIQEDLSDLAAKKERTYIFRFDPSQEPTPPALPADLAWVWSVAAAGLLLVWGLRRRRH
jgi:deazaflavin-dependent oxidoreductase (nitroreductase family)